jgi:hypothetical protein
MALTGCPLLEEDAQPVVHPLQWPCVVEPTYRSGNVQAPAGVIGALTRQLRRAGLGAASARADAAVPSSAVDQSQAGATCAAPDALTVRSCARRERRGAHATSADAELIAAPVG